MISAAKVQIIFILTLMAGAESYLFMTFICRKCKRLPFLVSDFVSDCKLFSINFELGSSCITGRFALIFVLFRIM